MKELEFVKPGDIEKRSFAIIAEELAMRHITIKEEEAPITMRVIHTSADFEYADTMMYSVHKTIFFTAVQKNPGTENEKVFIVK